jgi:hypothetical protein
MSAARRHMMYDIRQRIRVIARDMSVGTLKIRYPRVQVPGQDKRRDRKITHSLMWLTLA